MAFIESFSLMLLIQKNIAKCICAVQTFSVIITPDEKVQIKKSIVVSLICKSSIGYNRLFILFYAMYSLLKVSVF